MRVLGISANSRLLATAIIKNSELDDFHISLFKEKWSTEKIDKIIAHIGPYIDTYSISDIALTIPFAHYQNRETKKLITQIQTFCEQKNCTVRTYSPQSFQDFFRETRAKKKALMESMVEKYPELIFPYRKELKNKRRYYHKLFEAVAAGTLLTRELSYKT